MSVSRKKTFVRTVLGDIAADNLGVTYAHEHTIIERSYGTEVNADLQIDSVEKAVEELAKLFEAGCRALVDTMPAACGRNAVKLAEVSQKTGLHIVCPTGLHLPKYYPQGHWSERFDVEQLAELFVADINEGVDRNDYNGPFLQRTAHRAGIIKVAAGETLGERERKIFEAAAIAHRQTGAPVITHTAHGEAALEQVRLLEQFGVAPDSVTLSHTDRKPDAGFHREILSTGVFVEYDGAFRWKTEGENPTKNLIVEMFASGYGNQIMLGMDAARRNYWKAYGGAPGMLYLLEIFAPELIEAGLSGADLTQIFVRNPARAFAFVEN